MRAPPPRKHSCTSGGTRTGATCASTAKTCQKSGTGSGDPQRRNEPVARGLGAKSSARNGRSMMPLEELHLALVLLRRLERLEGAGVAAPAGARIPLDREEAILSGFEFPDHGARSTSISERWLWRAPDKRRP